MPDVLAWISLILTFVFGMVSLIQFFRNRAMRGNMMAAKGNFDSISDTCKNALRSENLSIAEARQIFTSIRYMARSGNNTLDMALPKKPTRLIEEGGNE